MSNNLRLTGLFLNVDGDFDATGGTIDFDSDDPEIHSSFGDNAHRWITILVRSVLEIKSKQFKWCIIRC